MRILRKIKQSSLALDLYAWATYKVFNLRSSTAISWKSMHKQFGSEYGEVDEFRRKALIYLKRIKGLYPDFDYDTERGRIIIKPSKTSVAAVAGKAPKAIE
jgi:hypothetical protein